MDISLVALDQHLGNTCRCAEVSVYLERRVRVPKVGKSAVCEQGIEQIVSAVAVFDPCPGVHLVTRRPAGGDVSALV